MYGLAHIECAIAVLRGECRQNFSGSETAHFPTETRSLVGSAPEVVAAGAEAVSAVVATEVVAAVKNR
jgi:hypothetical protein